MLRLWEVLVSNSKKLDLSVDNKLGLALVDIN